VKLLKISLTAAVSLFSGLAFAGGGSSQHSDADLLLSCTQPSQEHVVEFFGPGVLNSVGVSAKHPIGFPVRSARLTNGSYVLEADDSSGQVGGQATASVQAELALNGQQRVIQNTVYSVNFAVTQNGVVENFESRCRALSDVNVVDFSGH
jgi:hypothetical protein